MALAQQAKKYSQASIQFDIIEFASSPHGLNIKLIPQQRFVLKVLEKLPLDNTIADIEIRDQFNEKVLYTFTEVEFYDYLLSKDRISLDYETYCKNDNIQIMLAIGRRGTKTSTIAIYIAYKLYQVLNIYHPQKYFGILENDPMNITMTALGQENANKLFKRFYGIIKYSHFFKPFLLEPAVGNSLKVWTRFDLDHVQDKANKPDAHTNSITVEASPNTPGVRGENNMFVVMDEFAHFNTSSRSTREAPVDVAIYDSLTPSVAGFKNPDNTPFGKTLIFSSTGAKKGKFYEEVQNSFNLGAKSASICICAATWEMNPNILPAYLKSQWEKSPNSFKREFGAEFIEGETTWIKELGAFYRAFDNRLDHLAKVGDISKVYFLGGDFALSSDGTAFSIMHFEPFYEEDSLCFLQEAFSYDNRLEGLLEAAKGGKLISGKFVLDYGEARYAGEPPYEEMKTIQIDDVLKWLESLYARWPIQYGFYDQWSGEIIQQMCRSRGIKRFEMVKHTALVNDSQYKLFMLMMNQNKLKFPYFEFLKRELLGLISDERAQGVIAVKAGGSTGHDDLFDSIIRALYACHSFVNKNKSVVGIMPSLFSKGSLIRRSGSLNDCRTPKDFQIRKEMYHSNPNNIRDVKKPRFRGH